MLILLFCSQTCLVNTELEKVPPDCSFAELRTALSLPVSKAEVRN